MRIVEVVVVPNVGDKFINPKTKLVYTVTAQIVISDQRLFTEGLYYYVKCSVRRLKDNEIEPNVQSYLSRDYIKKHKLVPYAYKNNETSGSV